MNPTALIWIMCAFLGLNLLGMHATATLLPFFIAEWSLTGTEAGWLNGVMGLTSTLAIPILTITDRIDSRRILLLGTWANVIGFGGFAWFADDFNSALVFRGIQGLGFAGTYMVGVKAISDRMADKDRPRATSRYISSFPICASSSVVISATLADAFGWQAAYVLPAATAFASFFLVLILLPPVEPEPGPKRSLFDMGPVIHSKPALGFGFGAFMHSVELLGVRSWSVAFYVFAASQYEGLDILWLIPAATTLLILMGSPTSFAGGDAGAKWGYARVTALVMIASGGVCSVCGICSCLAPMAAARACARSQPVRTGRLRRGECWSHRRGGGGQPRHAHHVHGAGQCCRRPGWPGNVRSGAGCHRRSRQHHRLGLGLRQPRLLHNLRRRSRVVLRAAG